MTVESSRMRPLLLLFPVAVLAGCDWSTPRAEPREPRPPAKPRLEATIDLPGGDGRAHIIVVPTGFMESARCVVVVSPGGSPAVSCAPKDLDALPDKD
jgi:hypothetical protein